MTLLKLLDSTLPDLSPTQLHLIPSLTTTNVTLLLSSKPRRSC